MNLSSAELVQRLVVVRQKRFICQYLSLRFRRKSADIVIPHIRPAVRTNQHLGGKKFGHFAT